MTKCALRRSPPHQKNTYPEEQLVLNLCGRAAAAQRGLCTMRDSVFVDVTECIDLCGKRFTAMQWCGSTYSRACYNVHRSLGVNIGLLCAPIIHLWREHGLQIHEWKIQREEHWENSDSRSWPCPHKLAKVFHMCAHVPTTPHPPLQDI